MKKLLLLLVFLGISVYNSKGVDEECLFEITSLAGASLNADMSNNGQRTTIVYIDTCGLTDIFGNPFNLDSIGSIGYHQPLITEKRYYANELFEITFPDFPFDTNGFHLNTKTYFTENDIKNKYESIKNSLQILTNQTGEIKFYCGFDKSDTCKQKSLEKAWFYASFDDNIVNAFEIEDAINNIEGLQCQFLSYMDYITAKVFDKNESIMIFPNPAKDYINIEYPFNISKIIITNTNGEILKEFSHKRIRIMNSDSALKIETNGLTPGVYFVIIDDKYFNKFIVER